MNRASPHCPKCRKLEATYEEALSQIEVVVTKRFDSIANKLQALHKWQDARDEALLIYREHKRTHPGPQSA